MQVNYWTLTMLVLGVILEAQGQASFEAAKGATPVISSLPFALTADFGQAGLALDGVREFDVSPEDLSKHIFSDQVVVNGHFGVAAEKGKRTIFSKNRFSPGYDASFALSYVMEGQSECFQRFPDGSCQKSRRGGYQGPFVTLSYESSRNSMAEPTGAGEITLSDETQRETNVQIGWRLAPSERRVISLAGGRRWTHGSTEFLDERQVCTEEQRSSGTGPVTTVSECADRFVGTPSNVSAWQIRTDYLHVWRVSPERPGLAFLASAVWDRVRDHDGTTSLAAGPVILAKNSARQALGGLFISLTDLKSIGDIQDTGAHFSIKFFASVELPQL